MGTLLDMSVLSCCTTTQGTTIPIWFTACAPITFRPMMLPPPPLPQRRLSRTRWYRGRGFDCPGPLCRGLYIDQPLPRTGPVHSRQATRPSGRIVGHWGRYLHVRYTYTYTPARGVRPRGQRSGRGVNGRGAGRGHVMGDLRAGRRSSLTSRPRSHGLPPVINSPSVRIANAGEDGGEEPAQPFNKR